MNQYKIDFLKKDFIPLLKKANSYDKGKWGVLNAQQMVEHFADAVKNASGKLILPVITEEEKLQKLREFLMSEVPFKENTKNAMMSEQGASLRQPDMQSAINKLKKELDNFFEVFEKDPELKTINPFFGELNFEQNVQLLHKHACHHLRQFDLINYN